MNHQHTSGGPPSPSFLIIMLFIITLACVATTVSGCAAPSLTPLERQVRYEQRERSCRNIGGVWYHYGGTTGRCDYDPLCQQ